MATPQPPKTTAIVAASSAPKSVVPTPKPVAAPSTARAPTAPPTAAAATAPTVVLPAQRTILKAAELCTVQDKDLKFDYYEDSMNGKAYIGKNISTGEKNLIKDTDNYTSPIKEIYKLGDDLICITSNSVYIVHSKIRMTNVE